jgi:hypothetical protein
VVVERCTDATFGINFCAAGGSVKSSSRMHLRVRGVSKDSSAWRQGVRVGDVVVAVRGIPVHDVKQFNVRVAGLQCIHLQLRHPSANVQQDALETRRQLRSVAAISAGCSSSSADSISVGVNRGDDDDTGRAGTTTTVATPTAATATTASAACCETHCCGSWSCPSSSSGNCVLSFFVGWWCSCIR